MPKPIELTIAWKWVCGCGVANYEEGQELPAEEAVDLGVEEGTMITQPTSVICKNCMTYYEVKETTDG